MKVLTDFFKQIVIPICLPVLIAIIGAHLINRFIFFIAVVPTGSMLPTIQLQEKLIVTNVWDTDKLERGDIVVFYSDELDEMLIKRLIGLPGDAVEIRANGDDNAELWINGELIEEPYVKYPVAVTESQFFEVPSEHFLFLGDNRAGSLDARYWGNPYIHRSDIKGKATYTTKFEKIDKY